jgi:hypothetical protein
MPSLMFIGPHNRHCEEARQIRRRLLRTRPSADPRELTDWIISHLGGDELNRFIEQWGRERYQGVWERAAARGMVRA